MPAASSSEMDYTKMEDSQPRDSSRLWKGVALFTMAVAGTAVAWLVYSGSSATAAAAPAAKLATPAEEFAVMVAEGTTGHGLCRTEVCETCRLPHNLKEFETCVDSQFDCQKSCASKDCEGFAFAAGDTKHCNKGQGHCITYFHVRRYEELAIAGTTTADKDKNYLCFKHYVENAKTCSASACDCKALSPSAEYDPSCLMGGEGCGAGGHDCCRYCGHDHFADCQCCNNKCAQKNSHFTYDGTCDDGGPDSLFSVCDYGTDCHDCGDRCAPDADCPTTPTTPASGGGSSGGGSAPAPVPVTTPTPTAEFAVMVATGTDGHGLCRDSTSEDDDAPAAWKMDESCQESEMDCKKTCATHECVGFAWAPYAALPERDSRIPWTHPSRYEHGRCKSKNLGHCVAYLQMPNRADTPVEGTTQAGKWEPYLCFKHYTENAGTCSNTAEDCKAMSELPDGTKAEFDATCRLGGVGCNAGGLSCCKFCDGPNYPACGCKSTSCKYNGDGWCDDGGSGSSFSVCPFGTDYADCGARC